MDIDARAWSGTVTPENIEQVKAALRKRITTPHIAVDKWNLWTIDGLLVGDSVRFTLDQVELRLVYGSGKWQQEKTVIVRDDDQTKHD